MVAHDILCLNLFSNLSNFFFLYNIFIDVTLRFARNFFFVNKVLNNK